MLRTSPKAALPLTLALFAGCAPSTEPASVTWHQDVAPIVHERCGSCHNSAGIAPFDLLDYSNASDLSAQMLAEIESGRMPPFLAKTTDTCDPVHPYQDDLNLTAAEIDTIRQWVDGGAPEGDSATAAPLPDAPILTIENPSAELPFPTAYTVEPGDQDEFICFVLDPGNEDEVWLTGATLVPGNTTIDHHGLIYMDFTGATEELANDEGWFPCFNPPDELEGFLVATWTPGAVPQRVPENSGMPMPAGARLLVQMHYHPSADGPETDQSMVQLEWVEEQPQWEAAQALLGNNGRQYSDGTGLQPGPNDDGKEPIFLIPAGVPDHEENLLYTQEIDVDFKLYSVGTHMHYVGTDMQIDLIHRDSSGAETDRQCLVHTPNWDFNWQRTYSFDAPIEELPTIGLGDSLWMRCRYDNSLGNPFVQDALEEQGLSQPHDVYLGDETLDEMCLGLYGILFPPGVLDLLL